MDVHNFLTPDRKREVLEKRAQRLASTTRSNDEKLERGQFLCFLLGGREWFIETAEVREVFPMKPADLTTLPGAPEWALGATNVRGQVVGVLDTARLLQRSSPELQAVSLSEARWHPDAPYQPLLIVSYRSNDLGLFVESIMGVVSSRPTSAESYQTLRLDTLLDFEHEHETEGRQDGRA